MSSDQRTADGVSSFPRERKRGGIERTVQAEGPLGWKVTEIRHAATVLLPAAVYPSYKR